jgi:two-component system, NarL family, invasion response regulator UvrY
MTAIQPQSKQIKIAIVDDHNLFRKGLIKLINLGDEDNKYNILFEAENGLDMQEKLKQKEKPDIILMDVDMPGMDGYETVSWLQKYHPEISILVISMFETDKPILRMLKMKVKGYLSKDIKVEDMHCALEDIVNKGFYYTDKVAGIIANALQNGSNLDGDYEIKENPQVADLKESEREFIKLACTEMTYAQIAEKMQLSVKTVEGYRESLFLKFKLKNRVSLAMFAVRNGLVKV